MIKRLLPLALLLLGVAISLLGLELALRVVAPATKTTVKTAAKENQAMLPSDRPAFFFVPEAANSMRGNIFDPVHPSDLFRMFVIGDSFTFAPDMQFDDAFPARLQRMFNLNTQTSRKADEKAPLRTEVVNYGTPGFSSVHELETLKKTLALNPDLILLQITLNDPQEKPLRDTPLPFSLDHHDSRLGSFLYQTLRWSRLYQALNTRWFAFRSRRFYVQYHHDLFLQPRTRELFENSITSMASLAKENKVLFAAVIFPLFDFPLDTLYPFADIHRQIKELLIKLHVPYLDLLPRYEGVDNTRLQLAPGGDTHPNEIAHRIAAEEIYLWLLKSNLVPESLKIKRTFPHRRGVEERGFETGVESLSKTSS